MPNLFEVLMYVLFGSMVSLIGGFLLLSNKKAANKLALYATPFAAGALLAAAFFELIPEATHEIPVSDASSWILVGLVGFFLFEFAFHWFHHHHEHDKKVGNATPPLIIAGDTLHNLIDGIAIGAAFAIDTSTGIAATVAIAAHEIPQEIGDFGLLLKAGYNRSKIIAVNIISALASVVGAVVTFQLSANNDLPVGALMAITAGAFIYIAASDLLPTLHDQARTRAGYTAAALVIAGLAVVYGATTLAHEYLDDGHNHGHGSSSQVDSHDDHDSHADDDDRHEHDEKDADHHDEHEDEDHHSEESIEHSDEHADKPKENSDAHSDDDHDHDEPGHSDDEHEI